MSKADTKLDVQMLQPGEKIVGLAYITEDDEIIFNAQPGAAAVVLVEPRAPSSGPWAVRQRPEDSRY